MFRAMKIEGQLFKYPLMVRNHYCLVVVVACLFNPKFLDLKFEGFKEKP